MNKRLPLLTAVLLLTGTSSTFAASSTDLTVTGTLTPSACTPTLSSNNIDLGKIASKDLNTDKHTLIDVRTLTMSVNCDSAIRFALNSIDGRRGSAAFTSQYGLGLINGTQKLGAYGLMIRNPIADGVQAQSIASLDKGITWGNEKFWDPGLYMSVASMADDSQPIAVKDLTLDLEVTTLIARADGLDLSNEVLIDGLATLEVKYL
ncbi:DUF1120 domain-containing protein [Pseudomonas sp. PCH199]|uniref:DUF1120 domain-containing protein n=1 Tax=unclassified Pseudomonas TaxID=196821 RepID=UPI000BCCC0CD|nr:MULTISPECIES: DUF1120 domain-containing protein [unclassified Pseudomonas]MCW8275296.1 DUF1120 domain-containing protein [Pseudomonas sp. PCH199]PAM84176.1 hypothetical protein CES87_06140 [Pseudomonas sp. ERMR1:02]